MKNDLTTLNNYLFEQIERINDDGLTGEELNTALQKAKAVNDLASTIVSNANVQLKAYCELGQKASKGVSNMLGIESGEK